jgi:hypothetical protein
MWKLYVWFVLELTEMAVKVIISLVMATLKKFWLWMYRVLVLDPKRSGCSISVEESICSSYLQIWSSEAASRSGEAQRNADNCISFNACGVVGCDTRSKCLFVLYCYLYIAVNLVSIQRIDADLVLTATRVVVFWRGQGGLSVLCVLMGCGGNSPDQKICRFATIYVHLMIYHLMIVFFVIHLLLGRMSYMQDIIVLPLTP